MKDKLQSISIFILLGLIIFGIIRNYSKTTEITVSRANVIVEPVVINAQSTALPEPLLPSTNEPSYWSPLEVGPNWNSR